MLLAEYQVFLQLGIAAGLSGTKSLIFVNTGIIAL